MISTDDVLAVASKSLGCDISIDSSMDNVSEWDSLGHLSILSSLDEITDGKAGDLNGLGATRSVREIVGVLRVAGLLK
jgi:hypothetical protein